MNKYKTILYLATILAIIVSIYEPINHINKINKIEVSSKKNHHEKRIYIIFRNDDIDYSTNIIRESVIVNIFNKYNVKPIYAIIPKSHGNLLESNSAVTDSIRLWIKSKKIIPALHGLTHIRNRFNAGEWSKLPLVEQTMMIKEGKDYLDSLLQTEINIFCPPWNQADRNTILACKSNNINYFSGFLHAPLISGMKYINSTSDLFEGTLGTIEKAFEIANKSEFSSKHILMFHSSYNFNNDNLYKLDSLLEYLSNSQTHVLIDYNDEVLTENLNINELIFTQFEFINNKYYEMRIIKNLLMKIGLDKRKFYLEEYQKGVWAGDTNYQYSVIAGFTYYSMFLLIINRLSIILFILLILHLIYQAIHKFGFIARKPNID